MNTAEASDNNGSGMRGGRKGRSNNYNELNALPRFNEQVINEYGDVKRIDVCPMCKTTDILQWMEKHNESDTFNRTVDFIKKCKRCRLISIESYKLKKSIIMGYNKNNECVMVNLLPSGLARPWITDNNCCD